MKAEAMPSLPKKDTARPWVAKMPAHQRKNAQEKEYWTYKWRKARAAFLGMHPTCAHCAKLATCVDHITPVREGGAFYDLDNWQALCTSCHAKKSGREGWQARHAGE
jgi:5-methylcytosine-specific restriction protein A